MDSRPVSQVRDVVYESAGNGSHVADGSCTATDQLSPQWAVTQRDRRLTAIGNDRLAGPTRYISKGRS